ncbi:hypothetical protein K493DRAFT_81586 [Basidiobolus meristosporus CBS 931.73]|uniref:Uncharacterized protein n=1 Tax=Basidiobolus meristosporus CBS 931.73 TaxID=1314790 RepID=A0A1Y1XNE6_9FUNG|nr:hypothetical protein K493DRAFT_81586 [Basidiobolus meristosporus CBS 931.73]|eukprot:ORX87185.1 hypothetical protein K493DRAFT_81586 [Basidiobolus meristosporus CBS 931.73]
MSSTRSRVAKKPEGNTLITNFFAKVPVVTEDSTPESNASSKRKEKVNTKSAPIRFSDDSDLSDSEAIPEFLDDEDDELVNHVHADHKYEPRVQIEIRRSSLPEQGRGKEKSHPDNVDDEVEAKEESKPYRFSLNSLLSEKASLDSTGLTLQSLDKILKEKSLLDSHEEDITMYDTTELSTQILPEEKGMRLAEILASDLNEYQDIKCLFFVDWPKSLPKARIKLPLTHPFFRVVNQFAKDPESTLVFLESGLIQLYCDSVETLPRDIYSWLRDIAIFEADPRYADAATATLMYALSVTDLHIPFDDFIESLKKFGASQELLEDGFRFTDSSVSVFETESTSSSDKPDRSQTTSSIQSAAFDPFNGLFNQTRSKALSPRRDPSIDSVDDDTPLGQYTD